MNWEKRLRVYGAALLTAVIILGMIGILNDPSPDCVGKAVGAGIIGFVFAIALEIIAVISK